MGIEEVFKRFLDESAPGGETKPAASDGADTWSGAVTMALSGLAERFELADVYRSSSLIEARFPENHHVREKIRQQLQLMRDRGELVFLGGGRYQKVK